MNCQHVQLQIQRHHHYHSLETAMHYFDGVGKLNYRNTVQITIPI